MKISSKFSILAIASMFFVFSFVLARADQVTAGSTVVLSVTADGTAPFTFQWKKDGINLPGANSSSLTIANIQNSNAGSYAVVVSNPAGSTTSDFSSLVVVAANAAPAITSQPSSQSVVSGSAVAFTVTATGNPAPSYQWKKNGATISGATSATLNLSNVQSLAGGTYTVVVSNSAGSVTSSGAVLTVAASAVAPVITAQPVSKSVINGTTVNFTVVATGTPAPTYVWKKNGTTISGAVAATLSLTNVQSSSAGTYTVVVSNSAGSVTSSGAVLSVSSSASAPVITAQPLSQTIVTGENVTFRVVATGTPTPTFQWKKDGVVIAGSTGATLTISNALISAAGIYTVVATNSGGSVTSLSAKLTVVSDADSITFNNVLWQNKATGQRALWVMDGSGSNFTPVSVIDLGYVDANWVIAGTGDFNMDGSADILWQNTATGQRALWLMSGVTGGFTPKNVVNLGYVDVDWVIAGTGDFNMDGSADILWQNTTTGQRALWLMNGVDGGFTPQSVVDLGYVDVDWVIAGTGDFNMDGSADIIWQNRVTGQRALWLMSGVNGGFTPQSVVNLGYVDVNWVIAGTGDFNGDQQVDILWQNIGTGQRASWLMNGITNGFSPANVVDLGYVDTEWEIAN